MTFSDFTRTSDAGALRDGASGSADVVKQICDRCGPVTYPSDAVRLTCPACGAIYAAGRLGSAPRRQG